MTRNIAPQRYILKQHISHVSRGMRITERLETVALCISEARDKAPQTTAPFVLASPR